MSKQKTIIGSEEFVSLPELNVNMIHARVDTGAATSSLGVKWVKEEEGVISCLLLNKQVVTFDSFKKKIIKSSFGHTEERYVVKILINVLGRKVRTNFTLADRSKMKFPILLGRKLLKGKFMVDLDFKNQLYSSSDFS
jgi:hypothetical protein